MKRNKLLFLLMSLYLFSGCIKEKPSTAPLILTNSVTNITSTAAVSGGSIIDDGGIAVTAYGVCWGTEAKPTTNNSKTADGSGSGQFSSKINGLTPGTTYHLRAYATNPVGTSYGSDMEFATTGQSPSSVTQPATAISSDRATLNGMVNANYLSTVVTFDYGKTKDYGQSATAAQSPLSDGNLTNVTAEVTGLSQGTTYHFRVKAVNTLGTVYGADMVLVTTGQSFSCITLPATNISKGEATLNGAVNAQQLPSGIVFEYGPSTSYGSSVPINVTNTSANGIINVSATIKNLIPGIKYHFRIKCINTPLTVFGGDMVFTSSDNPDVTSGLVAYYPFNGSADDLSGNGLNGTVTGAVLTTDRFGKANSAYSFTDNQEITIPNSVNRNLYPLSVSLWYKATSLITGQSGNIFGKYVSAAWNGFEILEGDFRNVSNSGTTVNNGFGVAPWYLRSGTDRLIGYYNEPPFVQSNITSDTWYHFVFTVDSVMGKIFVNGKLVDTHNWTGTNGPCNNSFMWKIGGKYDTGFFHGNIDDIRVYNRAINADEVQILYSEGGYSATITPTPGLFTVKTGTDELYFIDLATKSMTKVANTGVIIPDMFSGLQFRDNKLYICFAGKLYTYNLSTGISTLIVNNPKLAWQFSINSSGEVYSVNEITGPTAGSLYKIDLSTNTSTLVGSNTGSASIWGLGFDSNNVLWAVDEFVQRYGNMNTATGIFTPSSLTMPYTDVYSATPDNNGNLYSFNVGIPTGIVKYNISSNTASLFMALNVEWAGLAYGYLFKK